MKKLASDKMKKRLYTISIELSNQVEAQTDAEAIVKAHEMLKNGFFSVEVVDVEEVG